MILTLFSGQIRFPKHISVADFNFCLLLKNIVYVHLRGGDLFEMDFSKKANWTNSHHFLLFSLKYYPAIFVIFLSNSLLFIFMQNFYRVRRLDNSQ